MSKTKTLDARLAATEQRLVQLKAKAALHKRREKSRALAEAKRQKFNEAVALTRQEDAHRKIEMGGVVIAAGGDKLDPAELCGALLAYLERRTKEAAAVDKENGIKHLEARKAARGGK